MRLEYRRTLIIIGVIILILINFLFFWIGYQNFLYPKLGSFQIQNITEENDTLVLNMTESHNAKQYEIEIYKENELIYEKTSSTNTVSLDNFTADYNDNLIIKAVSINKNKDQKASDNDLSYTYKDATFQKDRDHYVAESKDLILYILGYNAKEDYKMELLYNQNKIYESDVSGEDIIISNKIVAGYSGRIVAHLKNKNNRLISTFNFYLNTPIVGKLSINNPIDNYKTRWNDIKLKITGGVNANHFYANLYNNNNLINRLEISKEKDTLTIPASAFQENTDYDILIEAVYEDYTEIAETASIHVSIGKIETTNPVYVSHNPSFIKQGTKVSLKSMTSNATIYYTTDGSDPTTNSMIYKSPLEIQQNTIIKTYAVTPNRYDSAINTYQFLVQDKDLVVYLSPSNQDENYGVSETGFTTEKDIMNKIADVVERTLKEKGVTVYRNYPSGDINAWVAGSNYVGADFHLAIHSNGSSHHTARGIEIYVDDETSPALSIASNIYDNIWKIYAGNQEPSYHRGVKYANGSLGEVNKNYLPCGALIEVAYHDQYDDALWIMQNIDKIGQNIANSIISYYN